jgi:hypothetical protein
VLHAAQCEQTLAFYSSLFSRHCLPGEPRSLDFPAGWWEMALTRFSPADI